MDKYAKWQLFMDNIDEKYTISQPVFELDLPTFHSMIVYPRGSFGENIGLFRRPEHKHFSVSQ